MDIGVIEEKHDEKQIRWNLIASFPSVANRVDQYYKSSIFFFAGTSWDFRLFPKSVINPDGSYFYLHCEKLEECSVEYNISLENNDGSVRKSINGIMNIGQSNNSPKMVYSRSVPVVPCRIKFDYGSAPVGLLPNISCFLKKVQTNHINEPKVKKLKKLDTLSANFKDLFRNKESCDTTLYVKDIEFKAHKTILMARSPVFAAMFLHDTTEKETGIITIPDCDPNTFEQFLEFLYCGELEELPSCDAISLYETSNKYNFQELKTYCSECLSKNLTAENVCDVVILAYDYDDDELLSVAQDFFNENLNTVFNTSAWESLLKNHYRLVHKLLKEIPKGKVVK